MKKNEVLELVKNALGLETKKEAEGFVKEIEALTEALNNGLEVGDKAKVGSLTFEKKHISERRGISTLGEKKEWVIEAHDELKVKLTKKK